MDKSQVPSIKLGDRLVRSGDRPYVVAEIGVNYENDMARAERMIHEAAQAGADAVKFQTYKASKIAAKDSPAYWNETRTQRQFFEQYDAFGESEYKHLAEVAVKERVVFLSTPFDKEAVDFLDPLVPAFKIASADITNIDLLRYVAGKRKPVLLSTGASTLGEIANAVETLSVSGAPQVALLHCVLSYPTTYEDANLLTMRYLQRCFPDNVIGYSDHTKPDKAMALLTLAATLGATILEKHFTLDKTKAGNDHYHSMDPGDLSLLVENLDLVWKSMGTATRRVLPSEMGARKFARRSLVSLADIPKGTVLEEKHLTSKRPGTGIPTELFDFVVGRKSRCSIPEDTILTWGMLE